MISFYLWIFRFRKESSSKGILARWFYGNDRYRLIDDRAEFLKRMINSGCSEFLLDTFSQIWDEEFSKVPNARIAITNMGKGRSYRSRLD